MDIAAAELIWSLVGGYFAVGVIVALILSLGLARRFDPMAAEAPWVVKIVLLPGIAALWPILVAKTFTRRAP